MKKRLRGLLALSVVACMVFAMTTGVASAVSFDSISMPTDEIDVSAGGTIGDATSSGSILVFDDGVLVSSGASDIFDENDVLQNFGGVDSFSISGDVLIDKLGYVPKKRYVSDEISLRYFRETGKSSPCDEVHFTRIPINYQLNYLWDGGSYKDTAIFTVKAATGTIKSNEDASIAQKKDGYRFAGWKLKDGTIIPA